MRKKQKQSILTFQNNRHDFKFSVNKFKRFLGYLLFSGYHRLPQVILVCSENINIRVLREFFFVIHTYQLKKNILFDNTKLETSDKLSKIRTHLDMLNKNFIQYLIL